MSKRKLDCISKIQFQAFNGVKDNKVISSDDFVFQLHRWTEFRKKKPCDIKLPLSFRSL